MKSIKISSLLKFPPIVAGLLCTLALPALPLPEASAQTPGDQDSTYPIGTDANGFVYALAVQGDDQAIVGGSFSTFHGASRNCLARVHTDGSLDAFSPGLAFSNVNGNSGPGTVRAVAVQTDGSIVAAGQFTVLNQPANGGVVRLTSSGSLDTNFSVGTGVADDGGVVGTAYAVCVLPSGQILVGGAFQSFDGVTTAGLVRLNKNGTVDTTFNQGGAGIAANAYGQEVRSISVLPSGKIVIGGYFSAYDGQSANCVARLNPTGTLDTTFNVGTGPDEGILSVAARSDGYVYVGGGYTTFDGVSVQPLLRLTSTGALDTGFYPTGNLVIAEADALIIQPDNSLLVGGTILSQGGLVNSYVNGLARYGSDGTQDSGFDIDSNDARQVYGLALQSDGKAVAASIPVQLSGNPSGNVYRYYDLVLPTFFTGEAYLGNGVYYLSFPDGNYFGYYAFLSDPHYLYHYDLGFEYVFDAADGKSGVYLYDFASSDFFYTSPTFPFPYLYDFNLGSVLYYYPDPKNAGHYNTNGYRFFYEFKTGKIITK